MTKEEVLQRANDYCNERSYDESTLTSEFKDKFADFFAKRNPDGDINDETILADLKFNLDTAKSASAKGRTALQKGFELKENEYKARITELNKKLGDVKPPQHEEPVIPKEVQEKLDELEKYKNEEMKKTKFATILEIAKKSVRQSLHTSFEKFVKDYDVSLEKDDKEQADRWVARFTDVFKDSIGDIKPLAPQQTAKREADFLASLPKVKVV